MRGFASTAIAVTPTAVAFACGLLEVRLDRCASTRLAPRHGLRARLFDPGNSRYLSLRSSGTLRTRKVVNGVATVPEAVDFTPPPAAFTAVTADQP